MSKGKKDASLIITEQGAFEEKYILTDVVLGSGSYAEVKLGTNKKTNENVAVKILRKNHMKPKDVKKVEKEVKILKTLSHKHVVKVHDAFYDNTKGFYYIVMEHCKSGDLFSQIVDDQKEFTEDEARDIVRTLAGALKYCKDNGVIHRDIKPDNILIDERGNLKVADFNLSKMLSTYEIQFTIVETQCGTPNYVSPEVLSGKPYNFKCDIWSLGVVLFLILSGGYLPFYPDDDDDPDARDNLLDKVRSGKWSFEPEEAWAGISKNAKDLLSKMMNRKPAGRITYEEILGHPWLKEGNPTGHLKNVIDTSSLTVLKRKVDEMRNLRATTTTLSAVSVLKDMMGDRDEDKKPNVGGGSFGEI